MQLVNNAHKYHSFLIDRKKMRVVTIISLILISLISSHLYGQIVEIKDSKKGYPLEMVAIFNSDKNLSVATNDKGQADISAFRGKDTIYISYLGYKTKVLSYADIERDDFVVLMKANPITLGSVVIAASRFGQSSREVPSRISSISSERAALLNPQTAADLLETSGEVFVQKSQQGGGSPMIRGFSTNRLLYTIDGIRMNTAIFRGGNVHNVISLDPFAVESTEVFFGPGSVIYGSDAIGGVMSFQTLTPILSHSDEVLIRGNAVTRYATANSETTTHIDVNLGWERWAMLTSISSSDFSDLRMGKHGHDDYLRSFYVHRVDSIDQVFENRDPLLQRYTGYSQMNIMQKFRYMPNNNWNLQYAFHYSETSDIPRYDRHIETMPDGSPRTAVWHYGPQKWTMNYLSIMHHAPNLFYDEMFVRMGLQNFEESRVDRRFNHHRLRTQKEKVEAYSVNIDFRKTGNRHNFFYGLEGVRNDVVSRATAENIDTGALINVPDRYPDASWQTYAGYLSYQYRFSEKGLLQLGGRYTNYSINADFRRHEKFYPFEYQEVDVNNNAMTASVGFIFTPDELTTVSLNASSGFRAPNVDDIGKMFDFQAGDVIVPNPDLKAETAYNAEINISKVFGSILKLDLAGYYTLLEDAMVRRSFSLNGQDSIVYNDELSKVYAIQNAAEAHVMGAHASIDIKLPLGLGFYSRLNYQVGEEEMEDGTISPSRHAAPFFATTGISYEKDNFNMTLYSVYNATIEHENLNFEERQKAVLYAKDEQGNPYAPSWYTLNFKVLYNITEHFSLSAGLENITDQRYRVYSSGLTAPGRNMIVSFRASF